MKWIKCSDRFPSPVLIDTYFVKQKVKDSDEDWFPGTSTFNGEWEISDGYEVIEWLDETEEKVNKEQEEWISVEDYEKIVLERLADKSVIKLLLNGNVTFDKWGDNIHRLVDKELGAKREIRVSLPSQPNK